MTYFNYPSAGFVPRNGFLFLNFFPPLFYMRNVIPANHGLGCWLT